MKSQFYAGALAIHWGRPLRLDSRAGELEVRSGRLWLTRHGDLDDHVLEAGERVALTPSDAVVVEPWQADLRTVIDWRPAAQPRLTVRLRGWAAGFAALARSAASRARRAQGCI